MPAQFEHVDVTLPAASQTSTTITDTDDTVGDTVIAVLFSNEYDVDPPAPTGWTFRGQKATRTSTASYNKALYLYTLNAAATGDQSFAVSSLASAQRAGVLIRLSGVDSIRNIRSLAYIGTGDFSGPWDSTPTAGTGSNDDVGIAHLPDDLCVVVAAQWYGNGSADAQITSSQTTFTRRLKTSTVSFSDSTYLYVYTGTYTTNATDNPTFDKTTAENNEQVALAITFVAKVTPITGTVSATALASGSPHIPVHLISGTVNAGCEVSGSPVATGDIGGRVRASATASGVPLRSRKNVNYTNGATLAAKDITDGGARNLDIWTPTTTAPAAGWPVIVHVHGGFGTSGDKTTVSLDMVTRALARGYAFVSVNYRLAEAILSGFEGIASGNEASFPSQIHDLKVALRFLRNDAVGANIYKINRNRIYLSAYSYGGQIAQFAAYSKGDTTTYEGLNSNSWLPRPAHVNRTNDSSHYYFDFRQNGDISSEDWTIKGLFLMAGATSLRKTIDATATPNSDSRYAASDGRRANISRSITNIPTQQYIIDDTVGELDVDKYLAPAGGTPTTADPYLGKADVVPDFPIGYVTSTSDVLVTTASGYTPLKDALIDVGYIGSAPTANVTNSSGLSFYQLSGLSHEQMETHSSVVDTFFTWLDAVSSGGTKAITGTVSATASVSGTPAVIRSITGTVTATALASGAPTAARRISGTVTARATAAGTALRARRISGTVTATATAAGTALRARRILGSVTSTAVASGTPRHNHLISGTVTATASATGTLGQTHLISGTVAGTATATGAPSAGRRIAGTVTATGLASGIPLATHHITGTVAATAVVSGAPVRLRPVAGTVSATGRATGVPLVAHLISGTVTATAVAAGDPLGDKHITGTVSATASASGAPTRARLTSGSVTATAAASGAPHISAHMITGAVSAAAMASGSGLVAHLIAGVVLARATAAGTISATSATLSDFEIEWADLLRWTVTIRNRVSSDAYGNVTWSAPRTSVAHVDDVSVSNPRSSGREAVGNVGTSEAVIDLPLQQLAPEDEITLPSGTVVTVDTVTTQYDSDGVAHHLEATWVIS